MPPFWLSGCNMQHAHFDISPHAGSPPGPESHLPSSGDLTYQSLQLSDAGNVPPAIPDHAPLQSRPWLPSPCAYSKYSDNLFAGPLVSAPQSRFLCTVWQWTWRRKEGEEMRGGSAVLACFESRLLRSRCSKSHVEKCLWSDAAWNWLLIVSWDGSWQIE